MVTGVRLRTVPTGGPQFARGALCECFSADGGEDVVGGAQMVASVNSSALAAQPFAIEQMCAGEFPADAGMREARERFLVVAVSGGAGAQ